jgi:hypothetical protein
MDRANRICAISPMSPGLIFFGFYLYLWDTLMNTVYAIKPRTLKDLEHESETASAAVPP